MDATDPNSLSLDDLRSLRNNLQSEDDVVSYARRVAQARLDLVRAESARRDRGENHEDLPGELRQVLSSQLTGGAPRPPRPPLNFEDNDLSDRLDSVCAEHGFSRLEELSLDEIAELDRQLTEFEREVSADRKERYERLDALSAELVRRYRDGEASVDGLLSD